MSDRTVCCRSCGYPDHTSLDRACSHCEATQSQIAALRADVAQLTAACDKWAEVSQGNYQRAKKAEAEVERLRGGLECALAICATPIAMRRLNLDPSDERLTVAREALKGGDA